MKKSLVTTTLVCVLAFFLGHFFNSEKMTINYDQPLSELIKGGDYNEIYLDTANYKVSERGIKKIRVKLFKFNYPANYYDAMEILRKISNRGYRPANLHELLQYKIEHPEPKICIIALGSVYVDKAGYKNSPFIIESLSGSNEFAYILTEDGDHSGYITTNDLQEIAFLAVKK